MSAIDSTSIEHYTFQRQSGNSNINGMIHDQKIQALEIRTYGTLLSFITLKSQ